MSVTFQVTYADFQAFERAINANLWRAPGPPFPGALSFAIMITLLAANLQVPPALRPWLWGAMFLLVVLVALLEQRLLRAQIQKLLQEPISVVADEEGVTGISSQGRDTIFWATLRPIIETKAHFFVLGSPKQGLVIPKRAFDSPAQCAEFGAFLNAKWAQHHPDAAPIAAAK